MRRYTAVMLMVLCAGCSQKTKPETQPPPVATVPQPETQPAPVATAPQPEKPAEATTKPASATTATKPAPAGTAPKPAPATTATKPAPAASTKTPPPSTKKAPPAAQAQAKPPATPQTAKAPATKPQPAPPAKATTTSTLDLEALKAELKQTKAIGLMTKLSLKNKVDDLLDDFRKHHQGKSTPTLAELRSTYDLLMMKVLSLLQDRDQKLASEIVSSREQIWGLLADPKKFATLPV
jgi:hypothetical protein